MTSYEDESKDLLASMTMAGGTLERRPPLYNAEDYVTGIAKFCKLTGLQMYLGNSNADESGGSTTTKSKKKKDSEKSENNLEMGLRQFSSASELLAKLKADLTLSFPSFCREFTSPGANDGVTLLLDLLKAVQLAQTNITGSLNQLGSRANHVMFKRALGDEFEALMCLKAASKSEEGASRLVEHPSGLFTVAVCVMSNYSKSRVLSLQLLSRLCDAGAHRQVSDAISMLRLRFGEPVRFKFLVGMLNSYNSAVFQIACLRFLNRFVETASDARERIMVQTELEEAGFDLDPLVKTVALHAAEDNSNKQHPRLEWLREEVTRWEHNYIDVNSLVKKLLEAERANKRLREEVASLREAAKGFESEKLKSMSTVDRLRQCCRHLQGEIDRRENSDKSVPSLMDLADEEEDDEDDDVLILLPSEINTRDLHLKGKREQQQQMKEKIEVTDHGVTVLSINDHHQSNNNNLRTIATTTDSGLSSDSSNGSKRKATATAKAKTAFPSTSSSSSSSSSSCSPTSDTDDIKDDKENGSSSNNNSNIIIEEDFSAYAERNVLHEEVEAQTAEMRRISTETQTPHLPRKENVSTITELITPGDNDDEILLSDIATTSVKEKISLFQARSEPKPRESEDDEGLIVPRKTPRPPPTRRRPNNNNNNQQQQHFRNQQHQQQQQQHQYRSRSVEHTRGISVSSSGKQSNSNGNQGRASSDLLAKRMEIRKRDIAYLHDLSDEDDDGDYDFDLNTSSNNNTLETTSAKSFGFVKPGTPQNKAVKQQQQQQQPRQVRRHKSFFSPNSQTAQKITAAFSRPEKAGLIRRAESFQHSRSVGDFEPFMRKKGNNNSSINNGSSVALTKFTRLKRDEPMNKAKSMDFLKTKILSRSKSNLQPNSKKSMNMRNITRTESPSLSSSSSSNDLNPFQNYRKEFTSGNGINKSDEYDWRQDTPFWRKQGKWARPAPTKKMVEEPWVHHHHHHQIPPHHVHPLNGGARAWPPIAGHKLPPSTFYSSFHHPAAQPQPQPQPQPHFPPPTHFLPPEQPNNMNRGRNSFGGSVGELSSKLEITELSDEEPEIVAAMMMSNKNNSNNNSRGRRSSSGSSHNQDKSLALLDLPSGLY